MPSNNRGVAYIKPGEVKVHSIDFPKLYDPALKKKIEHGVILKIISTNICGSDQHMVRGRTTAPAGLILGHEITGEVLEAGRDVLFIKKGDIVSVPFNIACVAGAGPVGLACAASCHLLGAAAVIVGDMNKDRLKQAKSFGCETIDLTKDATLAQQIEQIIGVPEVDCSIDCVGFEAHGTGKQAGVERPATVLNQIMEVTRAGGALGIPGLYVTGDPGAVDDAAN